MAKKEKEQKPVLDLDGVKYEIDDMTDSQKKLAGEVNLYQNHVRDIQNKLNTNGFIGQQLAETEKVFVDKLQKGVKELKCLLNPEDESKIKEYALQLNKLVGCRNYSRVDFLMDSNHNVFILEINTLPGLTDTSFALSVRTVINSNIGSYPYTYLSNL